MSGSCDFCPKKAVETIIVEAGNGANVKTPIDLCRSCSAKFEKDEYAFEKKHSATIEKLATEVGVDVESKTWILR